MVPSLLLPSVKKDPRKS